MSTQRVSSVKIPVFDKENYVLGPEMFVEGGLNTNYNV